MYFLRPLWAHVAKGEIGTPLKDWKIWNRNRVQRKERREVWEQIKWWVPSEKAEQEKKKKKDAGLYFKDRLPPSLLCSLFCFVSGQKHSVDKPAVHKESELSLFYLRRKPANQPWHILYMFKNAWCLFSTGDVAVFLSAHESSHA